MVVLICIAIQGTASLLVKRTTRRKGMAYVFVIFFVADARLISEMRCAALIAFASLIVFRYVLAVRPKLSRPPMALTSAILPSLYMSLYAVDFQRAI